MRGGVNTRKWHGDHGSSQDYTTFFFSNFPHGYTKTDLLKVFQRWAKVKEVFVSRRLNKWGRRFGFVRFFDVRNVRWLESELDQIIVGNRKLHVNIPKYRRTQEENERYGRRVMRNIDVGKHREEGKEQQKENGFNKKKNGKQARGENGKQVWVEKQGSRSFVEVVTGASQASWKEPSVKYLQQSLPWMVRSSIGQFKEDLSYDQVEEEFIKGGINWMQVRFLGDNLALLTPKEGVVFETFYSDNQQWVDSVFVSIKSWTPDFVVDHKRVWVRCYGLPLALWNMDGFTKVVGKEVKLVSVDDATLAWENVEFARFQVGTSLSHSLRWAKSMRLNDMWCSIVMEEEIVIDGRGMCKCKSYESTVNESSSETYVEESSLSVKSGEDELRQWEGECIRSWKEEDEREAKSRGFLGTSSKEQLFKESNAEYRDEQGKSCSFFMKEVCEKRTQMEGAEVGLLTAIACAANYSSSHIHADLAKVVVDIEVSSSAFKINGLGQVGNLEAQTETGRNQALPTFEGGPRPDRECCRKNEGKEVNWEGATRSMKGVQLDKYGEYGSTKKDEYQRNGEGVAIEGGNYLRSHSEQITGLWSPPIRQRKERGLTDLGDSSLPQRRRSVRLHEKQARSAPSKHQHEGKISASISDGDIYKCNSRLCKQGNGDEPTVLWDIGKTSGIFCHGIEEEVIQEYMCMEERDMGVAKLAKEGDKDGLP
ncbi:hypothetical protein PHAVU_001G126500 [Phaseolus vulgaris]|uniref:RRM domain-containing protein n=1 Tax=Phaseolus vulgaris TaxID=3885 RepID=V7CVG2_PHAVU|nr:hypothetical protein PHAVU_001G126500g [Phaseolus vulgaris]ESW34124.1 hypothetical protein PHAVU_001G126500g [Phaseolus vulgaris]